MKIIWLTLFYGQFIMLLNVFLELLFHATIFLNMLIIYLDILISFMVISLSTSYFFGTGSFD